jgi:heterogeneous nuclear ribonucleoprotein A1/A3
MAKQSMQEKSHHKHEKDIFKVFIGGLSINCDDGELRDYLLQFGQVSECKIVRDKNHGSKGYGFATFKTREGLVKSLGKNHLLLEKTFEIRAHVSREDNFKLLKEISKRKIFVSSLKDSIIESDLMEYFSGFGPVEEVLINRDPETQLSKGFGFVVFRSSDSAKIALAGSKKRRASIKNSQVMFRMAITKDEISKKSSKGTDQKPKKSTKGSRSDAKQQRQRDSGANQLIKNAPGSSQRLLQVKRQTQIERRVLFACLETDEYRFNLPLSSDYCQVAANCFVDKKKLSSKIPLNAISHDQHSPLTVRIRMAFGAAFKDSRSNGAVGIEALCSNQKPICNRSATNETGSDGFLHLNSDGVTGNSGSSKRNRPTFLQEGISKEADSEVSTPVPTVDVERPANDVAAANKQKKLKSGANRCQRPKPFPETHSSKHLSFADCLKKSSNLVSTYYRELDQYEEGSPSTISEADNSKSIFGRYLGAEQPSLKGSGKVKATDSHILKQNWRESNGSTPRNLSPEDF